MRFILFVGETAKAHQPRLYIGKIETEPSLGWWYAVGGKMLRARIDDETALLRAAINKALEHFPKRSDLEDMAIAIPRINWGRYGKADVKRESPTRISLVGFDEIDPWK